MSREIYARRQLTPVRNSWTVRDMIFAAIVLLLALVCFVVVARWILESDHPVAYAALVAVVCVLVILGLREAKSRDLPAFVAVWTFLDRD